MNAHNVYRINTRTPCACDYKIVECTHFVCLFVHSFGRLLVCSLPREFVFDVVFGMLNLNWTHGPDRQCSNRDNECLFVVCFRFVRQKSNRNKRKWRWCICFYILSYLWLWLSVFGTFNIMTQKRPNYLSSEETIFVVIVVISAAVFMCAYRAIRKWEKARAKE